MMPSSSCSSRDSACARRLARLELAAGKLPVAGVRLARRTLREQHRAVGPQDHRRATRRQRSLRSSRRDRTSDRGTRDARGHSRVTCGASVRAACPVPRELPRDAAAARSALQRELQRFARALVGIARRRVRRRRRNARATDRPPRGNRPARTDRTRSTTRSARTARSSPRPIRPGALPRRCASSRGSRRSIRAAGGGGSTSRR